MNTDEINKLLDFIYYKQKNFDGLNELYRKAKLANKLIKKDDVSKWLKEQDTHQQTTIDKVEEIKFKPIYSEGHYDFQIDLTFFPRYKYENRNYYVLFTAININSRYAYAYYAKNKEIDSIIKMLNDFLKNALIIENITCDKGSEFTNNEVKKWFNDNNINVFYVKDDDHRKLSIINRFHRTLKYKIVKLFTANDNGVWIDDIDSIIKNYNNTRNKGIYNYTPREASKPYIESLIIAKKREKTELIEETEKVYKIGQKVRLLNDKKLFDKLKTKYDDKVYTIIKVNKNTLDVEDDKHIIKNVKKYNVKVIENYVKKEVEIKNVPTRMKSEKIYKEKNMLKKEDIKPENIIETKRVIKLVKKYS